jgi:hypothetical protein
VELMKNEDIIKENLELHEYAASAWDENLREGDEDMRYIHGNPWDPQEEKAREAAGRACLCFDELGAPVNQRINDVRKNKRGIKIDPKGNGANDKTAELHEDLIRTIESKGGIYAYTVGYENALQRGMGAWAVGKRYESWDSIQQELYIRCLPNARSVLIDPDAKEAAAGDMRFAFLFASYPKKVYQKKWPGAEIGDFPTYGSFTWGDESAIQVAECWRIMSKPCTLYLIGDKADPVKIFSDDLDEGYELANGGLTLYGQIIPIIAERKTERPQVIQYVMSGREILGNPVEWEGKHIPIIPVFGKQYWIEDGGQSKRIVESIIRKARDGQLLHNYIKTAEFEAISRILKATHMAYDTSIDKYKDMWNMAIKVPFPYLLLDSTATGPDGKLLPPPASMVIPELNNIAGYEMADEGVKRGIQNAMGLYSSNSAHVDQSGKSGKAQLVQQEQGSEGNYHFNDSLDQAIEMTGIILEEMIPVVLDTQSEMLLRKKDETAYNVKLNQGPYKNDKGQEVEYDTKTGDHEVSISVGQNSRTQREEASKTMDLLLQSDFAPRIADLAIKIKGLGPLGDQMAERLTPPEFANKGEDDPNALKQKLSQMTQVFQKMTQTIEQMTAERDSKTLELESREKIAAMQADVDKLKIQADLLKTHETLTSKESIVASENDIKAQFAELQARIDMMSAEHGAQLSMGQAEHGAQLSQQTEGEPTQPEESRNQ